MASLPWQHVYDSDEKSAITAARVRRFQEHTGLRHSKAHVVVFGEYGRYPAGADHTLVWSDGLRARRYLVTTEPYRSSLNQEILEEWCNANGWAWRTAPALGMWNPPSTVLYVLSPPKNGIPLDQIKAFVGLHHVTTI